MLSGNLAQNKVTATRHLLFCWCFVPSRLFKISGRTYIFFAGVTLSRNTHQMDTRIWKFLFREKLAPISVENKFTTEKNYDSHRRSHDTHTKASRWHPTQSRSHIQVDIFPKKLKGSAHEGHAIDTRCQNVNAMCANLVAKASGLYLFSGTVFGILNLACFIFYMLKGHK